MGGVGGWVRVGTLLAHPPTHPPTHPPLPQTKKGELIEKVLPRERLGKEGFSLPVPYPPTHPPLPQIKKGELIENVLPRERLGKEGFSLPVLIDHPSSLPGLLLPPDLSVQTVSQLLGGEKRIHVMDVATQVHPPTHPPTHLLMAWMYL